MNTLSKTLVLVNPAAGRGRARSAQSQVAEYLRLQGHPADFFESQSAQDFEGRAAAAAAGGYASIVALGGDGSFQHLVKATLGADVILGFFPAGGGNDVAGALGIPKDTVAAAHAFLRSRPRPMDVLRAHLAGGKIGHYVGGGGLGLDAEAAGLANGKFRSWPGAARYVAGALWALASFEPFSLEIEVDGESVATDDSRVILAAVVNTPNYGAGVKIAPAAEIDDGLLDVVLVGELAWTRLVEAIPVLLRTGDLRWPEVRRFRGRRVCLRAGRPVVFHGDGEVLGEAPVEIENLPGAIRVAAPLRK